MKKPLSILLSIILMISICPVGLFEFTASAVTYSGSCGDNANWNYNSETATLTISGTGAIGNYSSTYNSSAGYVTTALWGEFRTEMRTLIINNGITSIGSDAFCGCVGFTSVTIPNSVKSIGYNAFYNCSGLNKTNFTGSVDEWCSIHFETNLSTPTFYSHNLYINDALVTDLMIPNTITTISAHSFEFCQCFTSVTIPDTITAIETSAFYGCSSITNLRIPASVTSIGLQAFDACSGLDSVTLGNSPLSIGEKSFDNCTALAHVWYQGSKDEKNNNLTVSGLGNSELENARWHYYVDGTQEFQSDFAGGSGTEDDPYLISTKYHLNNVRNYLSSNFKLVSNVEFTESDYIEGGDFYNSDGWEPIGDDKNKFTGVFDGDGHSIIGLNITRAPRDRVGMFGNNAGTIKNLHINGSISVNQAAYAGSIAAYNSGTIIACSSEVDITLNAMLSYDAYAGGITAYNAGTIEKCYNKGDVSGSTNRVSESDIHVAGISGAGGVNSSVRECYNLARIFASSSFRPGEYGHYYGHAYAGGIQANSTDIKNCYNRGKVTANAAKESYAYAYAIGSTSVSMCYYLSGTGKGCNGATSLTDSEMRFSSNYKGFDFENIWIIWTMGGNEDYPYPLLQCFSRQGNPIPCGDSADFVIKNGDTLYIYGSGETDNYKTQSLVPWYEYAGQIKEVIIDEGITKIGTYAFYCLSNLETVICKNENMELARYSINTDNRNISIYAKGGVISEYCLNNDLGFIDVRPPNLTLQSIEFNSISILPCGAQYEYCIDGKNWQTSNVFSGLSPATKYNIYSRLIKTNIAFPDLVSEPLFVATLTVAPSYQSHTKDSITLVNFSGYEYSMDGINWQESNVFSGLSTNKIYRFYQRIAKKETQLISHPSSSLITLIPEKPKILEAGFDNILVKSVEGFEYCLDDMVWQDNNSFDMLVDNTEYTIYQRRKTIQTTGSEEFYQINSEKATITTDNSLVHTHVFTNLTITKSPTCTEAGTETGICTDCGKTVTSDINVLGHNYSTIVTSPTCTEQGYTTHTCSRCGDTYIGDYIDALGHAFVLIGNDSICTRCKRIRLMDGHIISKPLAPTIAAETYDTVTLNAKAGYEYSKDGVLWQTNVVFNNLLPNTQYIFYQRIAETITSFASETSDGISVTTPKKSSCKANAPILIAATQTTVKLQQYAEYEYSKDGVNWQTSSQFTGLLPDTTYTFYQRVAETELNYAGKISEPTSVKTLAKPECLNTPEKPIVVMVDYNKITLLARKGYEYRLSDGSWQDSPEFVGLIWGKEYNFYQRIKETESHKSSLESQVLKVNIDIPFSNESSYYMLLLYIDAYGSKLSNGNMQIRMVKNGGILTLEKTELGVYCNIYTTSSNGNTRIDTGFYLTDSNRYITPVMTAKYYSNNKLQFTLTYNTSFDRSIYTMSSMLPIEDCEEGSIAYETFNANLQLLCMYMNAYFYDNISTTLGGFGFLDYPGTNDRARYCDTASNHHIGNTVLKYNYAATCESDGYTGDYCCSNCGAIITKGKTIPSLGGHQYSNSCDNQCNRCDYHRDITHAYTNECDDTCDICGAKRIVSHVYDNDCDDSCNICGSRRIVSGHDYKVTVINPTCEERGYTMHYCLICGYNYNSDYVDAFAHNQTVINGAKKATCTQNGYTGDVYCQICGKKLTDGEVIPKTGHKYVWRITKLATATENGLKEEICSICGEKTGKSQELLYTGHITGDINGDNSVNNKDLTRLFQYLSDWDVEVNEAALDVNGDGAVNNKDLTRLFQYLSDWDVIIY